MPPINAEKNKIVDLTGPGSGTSVSPQVVAVSSLSTQQAATWFEQTHWLDSDNPKVAVFNSRPSAVWTWPITSWPNDWAYTFPDVQVHEK
jgi:hypothetical protein